MTDARFHIVMYQEGEAAEAFLARLNENGRPPQGDEPTVAGQPVGATSASDEASAYLAGMEADAPLHCPCSVTPYACDECRAEGKARAERIIAAFYAYRREEDAQQTRAVESVNRFRDHEADEMTWCLGEDA